MRSLLRTQPAPKVDLTRNANSERGDEAERFAAAQLLLATRSELRWGSRNEDAGKMDLELVLDHPWSEGDRIRMAVQVKSGPTYGAVAGGKVRLRKRLIDEAARETHAVCALWVPLDRSAVYWTYVHPATRSETKDLGLLHRVTPMTRFALTRCYSREAPGPKGGVGVNISGKVRELSVHRSTSKEEYRTLGAAPPKSPVLGRIRVTRFGWRHMFRRSRAERNKNSSLQTIPHLRALLGQVPTTHWLQDPEQFSAGEMTHVSALHVLSYDSVRYFPPGSAESQPRRVVIRLREDVRFPTGWEHVSMMSPLVERRVTLLSSYHKPPR